jgi:1-acyl-sn-glycerol-3-phosphate acyltransferase
MNIEDYSDIAPLEGESAKEAVKYLTKYPQIIGNLVGIILDAKKPDYMANVKRITSEIITKMQGVNNYDDFQKIITIGYLIPAIIDRSIDQLTFSGKENLADDDAYLYFSNHRDIVLDCALLDCALNDAGTQMCEMAFGDNLMATKAAEYLFRINGGIVVKRSLPIREKYKESIRLSKYFCETIIEKNKSIWVAQKSGRSKDGIDNTSSAIIKMLYLSMRKSNVTFSDLIAKLRIVPVSISYEYDPCDLNKSKEEIIKLLNNGEYSKKKYEDLINMVKGLRKYKGRVHVAIGKPLVDRIYKDHEEVSRELDKQIHTNYKLWPTNYFAYDYLEGTNKFTEEYKNFDQEKFLKRYSRVEQNVRDYALNAYANPVRSFLSEIDRSETEK